MWTFTRMQRSREHETTGQIHGYEILTCVLGYDMKTSIEWMEVAADEFTVWGRRIQLHDTFLHPSNGLDKISIVWQFLVILWVWTQKFQKEDFSSFVSSCRQNLGSNPDWVFLIFNVGDHRLLQEVQFLLISSLWSGPSFPEGRWAEPDPQCEY